MTPNKDINKNSCPQAEDNWWGLFHIHSFIALTKADRCLERREQVWIRRFLKHQNLNHLSEEFESLLNSGLDDKRFKELQQKAACELSTPDKRRLIYNLAQLCKSKGSINSEEYGIIIDSALRLGIEDTEADEIINSVFSINDTFTAIIGLLALGFILFTTQSVIVPLVIAIFITMIINKVEHLVAKGLKLKRFRWLNKVAAMVVILGVILGFVMAAISSGKDIASRVPYYQAKIATAFENVNSYAASHGFSLPKEAELSKAVKKLPIGQTLSGFFSSLMVLVGNFFLVVVFTGFLVFSGVEYRGIMAEMNDKISAYISIKSMISLITGIAVWILCVAFGVDFALFWAILAVLLNYIPSVGAIIATAPPILIAFVQLESVALAVSFSVAMVAMQMVLGQVVEPKLMGDKLAVKPIAILLGLIFWGFLWGLPGMFLAAPLMALLRILASYFNFSRSFERLLAA